MPPPVHEAALTRLEVPHFLLLSLHAAPVLWPPFLWHMLQDLGQNLLAICLMDFCVHMFIILAVVHEAPFTYLVSAALLSLHALAWCLWPAGAAGLGAAVRARAPGLRRARARASDRGAGEVQSR